MAARTGRLLQNQNLNVHANGAGSVSGKADLPGQRKGRAGGRKPLGDLSNAGNLTNQFDGKKAHDGSLNIGKPSVNQAPKLQKSKNLETEKRIANKASGKSLTGSRKALSDISNSGKPQGPEIKNKHTLKPSLLIEESLPPSAIAEERILHDHKKCIKSQVETADVHHFFKTVGLEDDADDHMAISFELSAISKLKSESAYLELEEVPERLPEMQSLSAMHGSPANCKTPGLSSYRTMWNDSTVNFKLIETPKVSKN
ncbi:protein PATRONUS 2-like isoform X1 [Vigna unguiculata]|uniref:Protein PATRONUS 2 n=1 Tax=Vigna unguiculata TaxID=3917 RepID=A0A4D6N6P3_VIGUN|nr:protein PATRONUS 2-like isoform X1 [Vigna unguiculata]QCE08159.1 hypothetical protein DEO72_LG9g3185 [Vigna unguiculata]